VSSRRAVVSAPIVVPIHDSPASSRLIGEDPVSARCLVRLCHVLAGPLPAARCVHLTTSATPYLEWSCGPRVCPSGRRCRGHDQRRRCLRPEDRRDPLERNRPYRLLVHRHRLQRRALLRPPRPLLERAETYGKLERALRAEIDEDAWASPYPTESRPFQATESSKIAVNVMNQYDDEVIQVFDA